jgi:hypothetical protein
MGYHQQVGVCACGQLGINLRPDGRIEKHMDLVLMEPCPWSGSTPEQVKEAWAKAESPKPEAVVPGGGALKYTNSMTLRLRRP